MPTRFVWDEKKSRRNLAKHRVSFERASLVFADPFQLTQPDPSETEERWRTLGLVNEAVVLLVVHTEIEEDDEQEIRIISARKATRIEKRAYEEARGAARR